MPQTARWIVLGVLGLFLFTAPPASHADPIKDDATRRAALKQKATDAFKGSKNDCRAFAEVASFAATIAPDPTEWFEDMRLALIGEDWSRARGKRGQWYHGVQTGDSGFKPELKDGSSQVEHAFAAIYLGKVLLPGGAAVAGTAREIRDAFAHGGEVSAADAALWAIGGDIGERISAKNLKDIKVPILNTMCSGA